jgi:type III secretory pathway component EscT
MFGGEVGRYMVLLAWGMLRSLPLVWLIPAFGGPTVALPLRLAFGAALSGACLPILAAQVPDGAGLAWPTLAVREVLVGTVMGLVCACWFRAAEAAGALIDAVAGVRIVGAALSGHGRGGAYAGLMLLLAIVIFLEIGGIGHVVLALAYSYEAMPVSASTSVASASQAALVSVIVASGKLIEAGLGLSAPVVVALILADLVIGFLGRAAPQLSGQSAGQSARALLSVGVLLLGFGAIQAAMQGSLADFLGLMRSSVRLGR